jgi:Icc-related predicted phosphoesterase
MIKTKTKIISSFVAALASFAFSSSVDAETLKIGFVTDWEYGKQKKYEQKLPRKASGYLKSTVSHYNKAFHPDLIIGGGDYILTRSVNKKTAKKQLRQINKVFQKAKAPRLYCIGNHDLSKLSKGEVRDSLNISYNHSAADLAGVRIITMDTNDTAPGEDEYETKGRVSNEELAWLEEKLDTSLPVIVFSHHSPVETKSGDSWRSNMYDDEELRGILEKNSNVVAVFSGHSSVNYSVEKNGIYYVVINNLVDSTAKGSFADITLEKMENSISVTANQLGKKPATYNFSKLLTD